MHSDCAFANWLVCLLSKWSSNQTLAPAVDHTVGTLRRHISAPLRRQLIKPSAVASGGTEDHFNISGAAHLKDQNVKIMSDIEKGSRTIVWAPQRGALR